MLKVLHSKQAQRTQRYYEVPGPYTDKGHLVVLANIAEAKTILEREAWVVPLSDDERGARMASHLDRLANDYEQRYIQHWRAFIADIEITAPTTVRDATALYTALLGTGEAALLRLIRVVEDHTQWTKGIDDLFANDAATRLINQKVNTAVSRRLHGLRIGADIRNMRGRLSIVPGAFAEVVAFGVPTKGQHQTTTVLYQYHEVMGELRAQMLRAPTAGFGRDARDARAKVDVLLDTAQPSTRGLLAPLLQAPLSAAVIDGGGLVGLRAAGRGHGDAGAARRARGKHEDVPSAGNECVMHRDDAVVVRVEGKAVASRLLVFAVIVTRDAHGHAGAHANLLTLVGVVKLGHEGRGRVGDGVDGDHRFDLWPLVFRAAQESRRTQGEQPAFHGNTSSSTSRDWPSALAVMRTAPSSRATRRYQPKTMSSTMATGASPACTSISNVVSN